MYTYLKYIKFGQNSLIFILVRQEFLPPTNEVCEGYVFTGVCLSTGEGHVWWQGGHAWWWGGCMVAGACVVMGGVCGGRGSMHGDGGACVVAGGCA